MIRRGRREGWLRYPIERLDSWAKLSGVSFDGVKIGLVPGLEDRGSAVIATKQLDGTHHGPLMTVPRELILSLETVQAYARRCKPLGDVLNALDEFGQTPRGAILIYLLFVATIYDVSGDPSWTGVDPLKEYVYAAYRDIDVLTSKQSQYIKFLPFESLPTFWSFEEHAILNGTTLKPAIEAKLKNLRNEFDMLQSKTEDIPWCQKFWWDEDEGLLDFDDWLQVDAMYRSRALEYPQIGDCMVPCVDMANHASGEKTVALYDIDHNGDAVLLLRDGQHLNAGGEITITYGDEKGMCEMIFSYGFVEDSMSSARQLFLGIAVPDDDPLRLAKLHVSKAAPGVTVFEQGNNVVWQSDFIWLVCVNEEDGLEFRVLQTNDGARELKVFWHDEELRDVTILHEMLQKDERWNIFQLRAVALIQDRVAEQLQALSESAEMVVQAEHGEGTLIRESPYQLSITLRKHESVLLQEIYEELEKQKIQLAETDVVQQFLASSINTQRESAVATRDEEEMEEEEDFT